MKAEEVAVALWCPVSVCMYIQCCFLSVHFLIESPAGYSTAEAVLVLAHDQIGCSLLNITQFFSKVGYTTHVIQDDYDRCTFASDIQISLIV